MARDSYGPEEFWDNGFCLVRNAFPLDQIGEWREVASTRNGLDLFCDPVLRKIITSDISLGLARRILNSPEIIYFGDSNPIVGPTDPGFHKDNADKGDDAAPDWVGRYPIIRFGIYTDDHTRFPGGLDVRKGSHHSASVTNGEVISVRTQPGDLVIWNLRTSHSGGTILLRTGQAIDPGSMWGKLARRRPFKALVAPELSDRTAMFWTYATPGAHLDRYIAYLKTRKYAVNRWRRARYSVADIAEAAARGLIVRDVGAELEHDGTATVHEAHTPLPY